MSLERTITLLQMLPVSPERAIELGRLGYIQWLNGLDGDANYSVEATRALAMAEPFVETDPAIAAFAGLVRQSMDRPLTPLDLSLPVAKRRGGSEARRLAY